MTNPSRDPLDAVLEGARDVDLSELSRVVDDLVAVYMPTAELTRSEALAQFTDVGTATPEHAGKRRLGQAAAAIVGTVAGKIALGGAVAVAAVGGLQATDTVDVPFLPSPGGTDEPADDTVREEREPTSDPATAVTSGTGESTNSTSVASTTADSTSDSTPSDGSQPDPPDGTELPPVATIPAPTLPPTTLPPADPPILDPEIQLPGPTVPDTPG